ncbi:MAG: ThiF family adenylyltransferase [Phycisphaerales bacterium]|nr:ThiF family adenylyltransferase [Phycisphaerales bacterium]
MDPRYARQMRVEHVGEAGQARLGSSHAMIVGVGALGCVSADLLVRAGVGTVTIIDRDLVERSNLHRQPLFTESDADEKKPKAIAAKERLEVVNAGVEVRGIIADFHCENALGLIEGGGVPDVLIDGTDNFETRFLLNDCSVKLGVPYVYGGAISTKGSAAVFVPGRGGPCLRCIVPEAPDAGTQPTCESAGVIGAVSSIIGSYQAAEAMKVLMGQWDRVMGSMLSFDLWEGVRTRVELGDAKDAECVCCGKGEYGYLEGERGLPQALCGQQAVQIAGGGKMIDLRRLGASLEGSGDFEVKDYMIRGMVEHGGERFELTCFADGRAIVDGTVDVGVARAVYSRYISS